VAGHCRPIRKTPSSFDVLSESGSLSYPVWLPMQVLTVAGDTD
jgi:hypothetical protein